MDTIEFTNTVTGSCQCCGSPTIQLARFDFRDGEPFAVYCALLAHGPHERRADVVISLGDWAETASSSDRVTFACHLTTDQDSFNVGLVEPHQTSWTSCELGRILSREEALGHPWKQEIFKAPTSVAPVRTAATRNHLIRATEVTAARRGSPSAVRLLLINASSIHLASPARPPCGHEKRRGLSAAVGSRWCVCGHILQNRGLKPRWCGWRRSRQVVPQERHGRLR